MTTENTTTINSENVENAIAYLRAEQEQDGMWAYYDDATARFYRVSVEQLADLGERLGDDEGDAYSQWCAETSVEEVMPEYVREGGCRY